MEASLLLLKNIWETVSVSACTKYMHVDEFDLLRLAHQRQKKNHMHDAIGAVYVPRGKGGSTTWGLCVVDMACGHESH
jgi:hypothetical protein